MASIVKAFADNNGTFHASAEAAVLADLIAALGQTREGPNLAKIVMEKRAEIERAFADLDRLTGETNAKTA